MLRFNMVDNYHQQAPPSLTFASPLAKLNLANLDQVFKDFGKTL
jgi:hypothetical protein